MTALLETRGITQRFSGLVANSDVSISVGRGEIVGLIGPNGAGKSTTFNLITGVLSATAADDTMLALLQDSADAWIANYTGVNFAGGTFTEYFPGSTELLELANFPVSSVTSVNVDPAQAFAAGTVVDPSTYVVHLERGVIQSKVGPFVAASRTPRLVNADRDAWTRSPRAVQVIYTTATGAVPNDVKQAYAELVGHWYRQMKTQVGASFQNLDAQKFGDVTLNYWPEQIAKAPVPPDIERLLAPYRTPNL